MDALPQWIQDAATEIADCDSATVEQIALIIESYHLTHLETTFVDLPF